MGKIYNYVFNANLGTGASNLKNYNVDWDKMPSDCAYKLTFAFTSNVAGNQFNQSATLYCDLGQSYNSVVSSDSFNNLRGDYLGFLKPVGFPITAGNYLSLTADTTTNPPTYLDRRPQQSNITVECRSSASTTANYNNTLSDYTLVLCFEEITE